RKVPGTFSGTFQMFMTTLYPSCRVLPSPTVPTRETNRETWQSRMACTMAPGSASPSPAVSHEAASTPMVKSRYCVSSVVRIASPQSAPAAESGPKSAIDISLRSELTPGPPSVAADSFLPQPANVSKIRIRTARKHVPSDCSHGLRRRSMFDFGFLDVDVI